MSVRGPGSNCFQIFALLASQSCIYLIFLGKSNIHQGQSIAFWPCTKLLLNMKNVIPWVFVNDIYQAPLIYVASFGVFPF